MSIEIWLNPKRASRDEIKLFLESLGFKPASHLWNWPKGSINCHWFEEKDFQSFDGVEATIYPPSKDQQNELGQCLWALHTRTRASASPADKEQQNRVIRLARLRFGGNFCNDWYGRNRYTQVAPDPRDAVSRGIYLAYGYVTRSIRAVRFALPAPNKSFKTLVDTELEALATLDPTRVLYNALVPFSVAALEHFFGRCFKILLRYEPKAQTRLKEQTKKVDMPDVLAIQSGEKTIEDVVANWYSFQNIASIHAAFSDWFGIDFWKLLRRRRKVGKKLPLLESRLNQLIKDRHGIVHHFLLNYEITKEQIEEILDLVLAIVDTFVDYLESSRAKVIRD